MTDLTRREALRSIGTAAAAGAAVALPVAAVAASEAGPAIPPEHVAGPMARRLMLEGYIIDRDPAKLVPGAAVMFVHGNGELAIGTVHAPEPNDLRGKPKYQWRVAVEDPEETRASGYPNYFVVDAIGVVESGWAPRAGWDEFKRVYDHRLA